MLKELLESVKQGTPTTELQQYLEAHNMSFLDTIKLYVHKIELWRNRISLGSKAVRGSYKTIHRPVASVQTEESKQKGLKNMAETKLEKVMKLYMSTGSHITVCDEDRSSYIDVCGTMALVEQLTIKRH
jgi:hypothetical protein